MTASAPALPAWLTEIAEDRAYAWAIRAWRRAAAEPGAWFDHAKADRVVDAWPRWFRLTTDRFAGVPFRLTRWQEIVVRLLVGWKRPTETIDPATGRPATYQVRVFRRLLLWVPRKNGKTEFLSALALLFFVYEPLAGAEGYCFARDEDQANVPFGRMKAMLLADTALTGGATPRVTMTRRGIFLVERAALFQLLSGKPDGKHGRMPQVILGDEMHEWDSRDLEDNLRQGTGTRLQPIELYASTAGIKSRKTGFDLWQESADIVEGRIDDPSTLAVIFAAGENDDWQDEAVWAAANPTIGLTPTWDYLRIEARKAAGNPRAEAAFRRYHLNQWVEQVARWLPDKLWAACVDEPESWPTLAERMQGRRCLLAIDVAATRDVFALVAMFPPEEAGEKWVLVPRFWIPEETLQERAERDRKTPWKEWVSSGALQTTPGNAVDQNFVAQAIKKDLERYSVEAIGFDPWNATKLVGDLMSDGVTPELFVQVRQGIMSLGEPSKEFERLVFAGLLDHGGHPVLGWMARNVAIRFDENMNFMPARKRSADKIDGIVAAVMCVALSMRAAPDAASIYEEQGLVRV